MSRLCVECWLRSEEAKFETLLSTIYAYAKLRVSRGRLRRCTEFLMIQFLLRALRLRESTDESFCDENFQDPGASEQRLNLLMMGHLEQSGGSAQHIV